MKNVELRRINMPIGSTIRVSRNDGSQAIYIFKGTDRNGAFYLDEEDQRHSEIGVYVQLEIKTETGWALV